MGGSTSDFYPPRAGGFGWLRRLPHRVRRVLFMDKLGRTQQWTLGLRGFLWPGFGFRFVGLIKIARWVEGLYILCLLVFFVFLGSTVANVAMTVMLSLHVTGICFFQRKFWPDLELRARLAFAVLAMLVVSQLFYLPIRAAIESFLYPLRTPNGICVVSTRVKPAAVTRGETIAYRVGATERPFHNEQNHGTIIIQAGFGLGTVLGLPGDVVEFSAKGYQVNGKSFQRESRMPVEGRWVVPEKGWFIWPSMGIVAGPRGVYQEIDQVLAQQGIVNQTNLLGKPLRRWFFRRQTLFHEPI